MNLFEYIGIIAVVSIAIRAIKAISIGHYHQKAMRNWEHEQRRINQIKSQNRKEIEVGINESNRSRKTH